MYNNNPESNEQKESLSSKEALPEQIPNLKDELDKVTKTSEGKLKQVCETYNGILPTDPTKIPNVHELGDEEEKEVVKNDELLNPNKTQNQLDQLAQQLDYNENLNMGNQGQLDDPKSVSIAEYLKNPKIVAKNNTDVAEISPTQRDDKSSIA